MIAGYSAAGFGMGAATTAFFAFFLFFLTTVAGLNPAIGGLVILLAVLWDGVTDPAVGYLSDRCHSKFGKRRPFILAGAIPFGIFTALMFTDISFSSHALKLLYLLGINMAFWLFFTMSDIPWAALGSEISESFNEKTKIRTVSATFVQLGTLSAMGGVPFLVGYGTDRFGTEAGGWSIAGATLGLVIALTYLISWNSTRGCESRRRQTDPRAPRENAGILKQLGLALQNKSMRYLLALTLLLVMAYSGLFAATLLFMLTFNLGILEEARQAFFLALWPASAIIFTPVVGWIATRFAGSLGKAKTLGYSAVITAVVLFTVKILGLTPPAMAAVMITCGFSNAAFWLFVYVLAYDVGAVEAYIRGVGKDGVVVSIMSFTLKLGMALGLGLGGLLLDYYGFVEGASEQSARALAGIESIFFLWGGFLVLLGAFFCFKFPITKQKYEALKEATSKKASGEPYSEAVFADLL